MSKITKLLWLTCLIAILGLCQAGEAEAAEKSTKKTLMVSCGAGIRDAMDEIVDNFEQAYPEVDVKTNYAASGPLTSQILYGGRADVFMSPSKADMDLLEKKGFLISGSRADLLGNSLVLIVPAKGATVAINSFADLLKPQVKRISLGEPSMVPAGKYAVQAAEYYKVDYTVKSKATYAKDVRQALRYVETGNADAGLVYLTDAITTDKVKVVFTAEKKSHSPIVFAAAALRRGKENKTAAEFVKYLDSPSADKIFAKYGFVVLD